MTQTENRTSTGNGRKSNPPSFVAYHVADQGRGRKFWTRLGGVWPHKNGEGFTIFVNVLPVDFDGRIVMLPPREEDEAGQGAGDAPNGAATAGAAEDDEIGF